MGEVVRMVSSEEGDRESSGVSRASVLQSDGSFGSYRIKRLLGRGGMAEVYEAEHTLLKKRFAIKVLKPEFFEQAEVRERFLLEGESAARITHPNVVDITDVGVTDGVPYLVMEYLDGATLAEHIQRTAPMEIQKAVHLLLPVVSAVMAAHNQGVIHRDLKPENIVIAKDAARRMRPKVLDFGVSRILDSDERRLTVDRGVLGTPQYMPPEQARGERSDASADQYALGVILYEALTGRMPYEADSVLGLLRLAAKGDFPPPSMHRQDLDPELESIILKALAKTPEDRFNEIRELGAALLPFASERAQEFFATDFAEADPSKRTIRISLNEGTISADDTTTSFVRLSSSAAPASLSTLPAPQDSSVNTIVVTPKRSPLLWVAVALALCASAAAVWLALKSDSNVEPEAALPEPAVNVPAPAPTASDFALSVQVTPSNATLKLDGKEVAKGGYAARLKKDGKKHVLVVSAAGYESREITFTDTPPPSQIRLEKLAEEETKPAQKTQVWRGYKKPAAPEATTTGSVGSVPTASAPSQPAPTKKAESWTHAKSDNKNPWGASTKSNNKNPWK